MQSEESYKDVNSPLRSYCFRRFLNALLPLSIASFPNSRISSKERLSKLYPSAFCSKDDKALSKISSTDLFCFIPFFTSINNFSASCFFVVSLLSLLRYFSYKLSRRISISPDEISPSCIPSLKNCNADNHKISPTFCLIFCLSVLFNPLKNARMFLIF